MTRYLCAALALIALGCGDDNALHLYCGAGIRPPAEEAIQAFTERTGIRVTIDYAGSGVLLSRIKGSGRGDLYMPGDVGYIERAQQMGLAGDPHAVCYFVPVLMVPKGNPKGVRGLADLARDGVRVGLGDPEACAIGRLTERILKKNDLDADAILDRAVTFVTVNEPALQVAEGHLDVALVWDATAAQYADRAEVVPIPPNRNIISEVAISVLDSTRDRGRAGQLVDFMTGPEGRAIFKKHHYTTDPPQ